MAMACAALTLVVDKIPISCGTLSLVGWMATYFFLFDNYNMSTSSICEMNKVEGTGASEK